MRNRRAANWRKPSLIQLSDRNWCTARQLRTTKLKQRVFPTTALTSCRMRESNPASKMKNAKNYPLGVNQHLGKKSSDVHQYLGKKTLKPPAVFNAVCSFWGFEAIWRKRQKFSGANHHSSCYHQRCATLLLALMVMMVMILKVFTGCVWNICIQWVN